MLTNILMSIFKVVMSIFKVVTQNISSVTYIYVYIIFFCHVHQPIIIEFHNKVNCYNFLHMPVL